MAERVLRSLKRGEVLLLLASGLSFAIPINVLGQATAASGETPAPTVNRDAKLPVFDVVSIKPNKSGGGMVRSMTKPDGYAATNISLKMLIQFAYGIREDQISGAPGWADSDRYDIDAKVAGHDVADLEKMKPEDRGLMLRPLLVDRFKLASHSETKVLPIYELVIAKNGLKLKEADTNTPATEIKGAPGGGRAGMMMMRPGQLNGQGIPITSLVNQLSRVLHRTVVDKTGLTGRYDVTLQWTDERSDPAFKGPDGAPQRAEPAPDNSGPSIFTAVQEQLGLRLQSAKGPVETIVIDHVEMPSEN